MIVEQYRIRATDNQFIVDGLPEGSVKIATFDKLLPRQSRELSSMAAHRLDLTFAKICLGLINVVQDDARIALWRAAVVYYCKCFAQTNRGGRKPLHPKFLPAGLPRDIHKYFMSLRNMNLIHDENDWLQVLTGVVIAAADKNYKVEKVICSTVEGQSLVQNNYNNLSLLIDHALTWVDSETGRLFTEISRELEKMPRETLLRQPTVTYHAPEADDIHSPRRNLAK